MTQGHFFSRDEYAKRTASVILSNSPVSASRSGVFLAAPRRTGKSTFVREDLRSELLRRNAIVIYADLWEDRAKDPAEIISAAIREELGKHGGLIDRLAKMSGIEGATVAGFKFNLDHIGVNRAVSLSAALEALSQAAKKTIVLIIDEAQHALTTEAGENSLFGLKAARDNLNGSELHGLRVVATGSNRDKLAMLRNSKDQAFFGAFLMDFEKLGKSFIDWFCQHAELGDSLDSDAIYELFVQAGNRPEIIFQAADQVRMMPPSEESVTARLRTSVAAAIAEADDELSPVIHALTPIQRAVLEVMAETGNKYAPFETATMPLYEAALKRNGSHDVQVNVPAIQQALLALKEKVLVWKANRGVYALEDMAIARLLKKQS